MKYILCAFPIFLLLAVCQCKQDPINCRDEKLGNIYFHGPTLKYFPYKGTERLIFKNKAGSELVFTCPSPNDKRIEVAAEKLCDDLKLQQGYAYYEGDSKTLLFQTNDGAYKIEMRALMINALLKTEQDTTIIDVFSATFFQYNTGASLTLITSERGNSANLPDSIRQDYIFGHLIADTTINNRPLSNVFAGKIFEGVTSTDSTMVYSQKGKPVVAFVDFLNQTWVLDRVE